MTEGMDAQYELLKRFLQDLNDFNDRLRGSVGELEDCLEHVSPIWQDEMRRSFDLLWAPFRENILHYVRTEGPSHVEFINCKIHQTGRYLGY